MYQLILPECAGDISVKNTDTFKYVVKIKVGDRFYIGRSVGFKFLSDEMRKVYADYNYRAGVYENHLYYPIVKYMHTSGIETAEVEVLFKSENGYEVLKEELNQLIKNFTKKRCLNANNVPYIPKEFTTKTKSKWLTQNEWLNFKKLIKQYDF